MGLNIDLRIEPQIPENCSCPNYTCLKLLEQVNLSRLSEGEATRVWTVHTSGRKNWMSHGIHPVDALGFVVMPKTINLPDNVESHYWRCEECGTTIERSYAEMADGGSPVCPKCDADMEYQP
ncbi:hypothetical protein LCGC14_0399540 [marine sediment metagenome]|uniref:Uncharacterized protein n=1 Tax=marine sediment metagenome TaxID=412755 RepID=A0A0F9TF83_9ZZZZ